MNQLHTPQNEIIKGLFDNMDPDNMNYLRQLQKQQQKQQQKQNNQRSKSQNQQELNQVQDMSQASIFDNYSGSFQNQSEAVSLRNSMVDITNSKSNEDINNNLQKIQNQQQLQNENNKNKRNLNNKSSNPTGQLFGDFFQQNNNNKREINENSSQVQQQSLNINVQQSPKSHRRKPIENQNLLTPNYNSNSNNMKSHGFGPNRFSKSPVATTISKKSQNLLMNSPSENNMRTYKQNHQEKNHQKSQSVSSPPQSQRDNIFSNDKNDLRSSNQDYKNNENHNEEFLQHINFYIDYLEQSNKEPYKMQLFKKNQQVLKEKSTSKSPYQQKQKNKIHQQQQFNTNNNENSNPNNVNNISNINQQLIKENKNLRFQIEQYERNMREIAKQQQILINEVQKKQQKENEAKKIIKAQHSEIYTLRKQLNTMGFKLNHTKEQLAREKIDHENSVYTLKTYIQTSGIYSKKLKHKNNSHLYSHNYMMGNSQQPNYMNYSSNNQWQNNFGQQESLESELKEDMDINNLSQADPLQIQQNLNNLMGFNQKKQIDDNFNIQFQQSNNLSLQDLPNKTHLHSKSHIIQDEIQQNIEQLETQENDQENNNEQQNYEDDDEEDNDDDENEDDDDNEDQEGEEEEESEDNNDDDDDDDDDEDEESTSVNNQMDMDINQQNWQMQNDKNIFLQDKSLNDILVKNNYKNYQINNNYNNNNDQRFKEQDIDYQYFLTSNHPGNTNSMFNSNTNNTYTNNNSNYDIYKKKFSQPTKVDEDLQTTHTSQQNNYQQMFMMQQQQQQKSTKNKKNKSDIQFQQEQMQFQQQQQMYFQQQLQQQKQMQKKQNKKGSKQKKVLQYDNDNNISPISHVNKQ